MHPKYSKAKMEAEIELSELNNMPVKLFNVQLMNCFQNKNDKRECLDPDEISLIIEQYKLHHSEGMTEYFFKHLKNCGNIEAIEQTIDNIYTWEIQQGHERSEVEVTKCIMENVKDPVLKNWVLGLMNRGSIYLLEKACGFHSKSMSTIKMSVSIIYAFLSLIWFYWDMYKDIIFFFILDHIWTKLLVSKNVIFDST